VGTNAVKVAGRKATIDLTQTLPLCHCHFSNRTARGL
jgi:hypothetical protein